MEERVKGVVEKNESNRGAGSFAAITITTCHILKLREMFDLLGTLRHRRRSLPLSQGSRSTLFFLRGTRIARLGNSLTLLSGKMAIGASLVGGKSALGCSLPVICPANPDTFDFYLTRAEKFVWNETLYICIKVKIMYGMGLGLPLHNSHNKHSRN